MTKETSPYFEEKFSFFENKRWLSSALACIAGVALLIVYSQMGPKPEAFVAAEQAIALWEKGGDDASYNDMRKALRKVPTLEKKYEATIAQKLFEKDKIDEALILAHNSLKRIENDAPFHAAYGEITLLIEQGLYQNALEGAVRLKEQMKSWSEIEYEGGSVLYAHNLLRIAFLQQELNNRPGEKYAWEELENFLKDRSTLSRLVYGNFREKGLDLTHYISERKKHL